jgi:succinate dehydrogenase/fumarate reductase flavoprotein subunit
VWQETNNPRTTGRRYEARALTDVLVRAAGPVRFGAGDGDVHRHHAPLILATGGFPVRLARERRLLLRANRWSEGDGLELARSRGGTTAGDLGEFYGRAMPAPPARVGEADFVRLAQLWRGRARVVNERGEEFFPAQPAWHENDLAQAIARQPGGSAWFVVDDPNDERVLAARGAGGTVLDDDGHVRIRVAAAVTHTLGGIRVDDRARVAREDGTPIEGLFAAGVDVGGVANGGYASGLAQALVLGLVAAESALELLPK